jgi:hypothetical protein
MREADAVVASEELQGGRVQLVCLHVEVDGAEWSLSEPASLVGGLQLPVLLTADLAQLREPGVFRVRDPTLDDSREVEDPGAKVLEALGLAHRHGQKRR